MTNAKSHAFQDMLLMSPESLVWHNGSRIALLRIRMKLKREEKKDKTAFAFGKSPRMLFMVRPGL